MKEGAKKDEAFLKFLNDHPTNSWGAKAYDMLDRHLTCKSPLIFQARIDELVYLLQEARLDGLSDIIDGCRRFEKQRLERRKFDTIGRSLFGPTDRIRILGDKLEEIYRRFRPADTIAAA